MVAELIVYLAAIKGGEWVNGKVASLKPLTGDAAKLAEKQAAQKAANEINALLDKLGVSQRIPAPSGGAQFKTWNQFQAGTKGQFPSRAESGRAWATYKEANGIVTGSVRSSAVKGRYLRSLVDDYRTPSWMKQWLREARVPPGYEVDHIKPLSIGGPDTPANMRLRSEGLHDMWHKYYDPWNW